MPPALEASAPKLRTSCDNCGVTKVRCDRGQPQCRRCVTLGLTCVYGLSRKSGKSPRRRLAAAISSAPTLPYQKRKVRSAESYKDPTMDDGQHHEVYVPAQHELSNLETVILPSPYGVNTTDIYEPTKLGLACSTPLPFDEWPSFEGLGNGLGILSVPNNTSEDQGSSSALEPVNAARKNANNHESHSCPRESYEILRDLICPTPYLHAPEANSDTVCAQLDFVLHFTRSAIGRLAALLKCSCAKSGHRVMVHASIISRILIWYQQAAGWTGSNSGDSLPSASADSTSFREVSSSSLPPSAASVSTSTAKAPTLAQSTGFVVAHVPVSMGTFSIEDQNMQAALRNQLVLSELKRIADLIDLFASQDLNESPVNGLASLCSCLGAWLQGEHSRIVRVLRARLRAINEDLDS